MQMNSWSNRLQQRIIKEMKGDYSSEPKIFVLSRVVDGHNVTFFVILSFKGAWDFDWAWAIWTELLIEFKKRPNTFLRPDEGNYPQNPLCIGPPLEVKERR